MPYIKILGAGPAGLSAAINLANEGYIVDVFEKNKDIGSRVQKNIQGLENWSDNQDIIKEFRKMKIKPNFDYEPFKKLRITNNDENWDFYCKRPAFYLVKRGTEEKSLDQGLKEQALDKGVNIHFEETAPIEDVDIVATGPDPRNKFAVARGLTFKTELDNIAIGLINNYHAFKGYSYLLVSNGSGCIATVLFEGFDDLNKYFKRTFDTFSGNFDLKMEDQQKFAGYGSFSNKIRNENKIVIGERAGFQDLLWGFGIRNALKSGFIAANNILEGNDSENYYKNVEKYFRPKIKAGIVNRFIWEKFASSNYSLILNRIHKSKDPLRYLHSFYNFNLFQKVPIPLRYSI
ncbi:NAD(P)/FAD-dependent oxidoreductase [Methanobacterium sp. SMA-27]|uniref:NAD(P)/FAD-dependent oxidoreductase n=1 Tax=Methanobacterium sp. SMA-27 TaxID=1495336 RepID=UPI00064E7DB0|nr:NAD(P)-binding protein [Methanobacterium sp. SMA-27]